MAQLLSPLRRLLVRLMGLDDMLLEKDYDFGYFPAFVGDPSHSNDWWQNVLRHQIEECNNHWRSIIEFYIED